jgi:hypothetical protein
VTKLLLERDIRDYETMASPGQLELEDIHPPASAMDIRNPTSLVLEDIEENQKR